MMRVTDVQRGREGRFGAADRHVLRPAIAAPEANAALKARGSDLGSACRLVSASSEDVVQLETL